MYLPKYSYPTRSWPLWYWPGDSAGPGNGNGNGNGNGGAESEMSWKIIVPESTTNKCLNPSAEESGNFAAVGATVTRVTTYGKYGLRSYRVQSAADNQGMSLTLAALANATHYVTLRVRGTLPAAWDWSLDNVNYATPSKIIDLDDDWAVYGCSFPAAQANGSTTLYVRQNGSGSGDFYLDGVQVEEADHWTTYCDGDQEGCEWLGSEHGSQSRRSGRSRAGGRVYDLQDDYHFDIGAMIGAGAAPHSLSADEYAILPGGELNSVKVHPRPLTLTGVIRGTSWSNLHSNKQALLEVLMPGAVPRDADGYQPVRLRYTGASVMKEISVHYEAGLEGSMQAYGEPYYWERVALRFLANDPFWYEIGESAQEVDPEAVTDISDSVRHITGRLRTIQQVFAGMLSPWSSMNVSSNPASGTVYTITVGPDGKIYIGGTFTNWDGVANRNYVAVYDPVADSWATLGSVSDFNGAVYALTFGPDGTLYAGGAFTNCAADANADYVAKWNGSAWSAVSGGGTGTVRALAFGLDGTLYIGGDFTNWNAVANADYVVSWDGSSYAALSTGANGVIYALAVGPDGTLFAGGNFTTIGGNAANRVAEWDGSAWSAMGDGFDDDVRAVVVDNDGTVYVGGDFPAGSGSDPPYHVAEWNGSAWTDLDSGVFDSNVAGSEHVGEVRSLSIGPDGMLYAAGDFTYLGSGYIHTPNIGLGKWNGSTWVRLDLAISSDQTAQVITTGNPDPIIKTSYDVYVGLNFAGLAFIGASTTVTNNGTENAYPRIVVKLLSGGTTADVVLIRNETTGKELFLNYTLQEEETLTIDLRPAHKSVVSSFYGSVPMAVLPNSDFGTFALQPGDNVIVCYLAHGSGTSLDEMEVQMIWQDTYKSQD